MPRLDVWPNHRLLVQLLRDPSRLTRLTPHEFSLALDVAEDARLLGWLLAESRARNALANAPAWLSDRISSAVAQTGEYDRALRWEISRLARAFHGSTIPWTLLKGAAYLAASLPPGAGRRVADIDVLVPFGALAETERRLQDHGWKTGTLDPYDERYYRQWMHELPPMHHEIRGSVVDVHHAILPRTSRLRPSSDRLLDRSREVDAGVRVLCPSHMVLHSAAHLFHDGEISGAIRDLVDLDRLLRHFNDEGEFWPDFLTEAAALDLTRPAFYALRYSSQLLGTPLPERVSLESAQWAPNGGTLRLMDALVRRTLQGRGAPGSRVAAGALYLRSHWLRMPPRMLVSHLWQKARRRD